MNTGLMDTGLRNAELKDAELTDAEQTNAEQMTEGTAVVNGYTQYEFNQYEVPVDPMQDLQCDSCQ